METVTVVTVYNACNYGSFLQAFALKKYIEENGYKVNYLEMNVDEDKVIGKNLFSDEYVTFETQKYIKIQKEQAVFDTVKVADIDSVCCVLGSDTIWNMFDPAYSEIPYFVGRDIPCNNIISYAASVGQNNYYKILLLKLCKLLPIRRLSNISVRDDKTERFVKFLGRTSTRVLDPTFLVDFNEQELDNFDLNDYMLVYTYGFSEEEVEAILEVANMLNLKIVATGSLCSWADYNLSVGSFEWLWLVKNAKLVITNTFHGTVFSIKYNKQFASLALESDKVVSLLKELGLSERNCCSSQLKDLISENIDYTNSNNIIKDKVLKSKEYLIRGIKSEY